MGFSFCVVCIRSFTDWKSFPKVCTNLDRVFVHWHNMAIRKFKNAKHIVKSKIRGISPHENSSAYRACVLMYNTCTAGVCSASAMVGFQRLLL